MKKLTLFTCAMLIALSGLLAQHENVILEKVSPEKVPPAVVSSVEKDSPGVIVEQYGLIPAEAYNEHMVSAENTLTIDGFAETMVYLVDVNYEKIKIYAIYDAKGNVIQVRDKVKDYIIPVSVVEYIEKEYPG